MSGELAQGMRVAIFDAVFQRVTCVADARIKSESEAMRIFRLSRLFGRHSEVKREHARTDYYTIVFVKSHFDKP